MKTLMHLTILFLSLVVAQSVYSQPFFIDSEPVMVQRQDGTYSWFVGGTLVPIDQPKGRLFSWEEIPQMKEGGTVKRSKDLEAITRFSLQEFPFLTQDVVKLNHEFTLTEKGIITTKEEITVDVDKNQVVFWLILIFLSLSMAAGITSPHESPLTFSFVGMSMVGAILAACYFGWWAYGIGLIVTIAMSRRSGNLKGGWMDQTALLLFFGLLLIPFAFNWLDQESKKLFTLTIASIVALGFIVSGLYMWRKKKPQESTARTSKGGIIRY
jgi:hypothetical protein